MVPPARGNIRPQICPRKIWIGIRGSEPRRKKLSTLLSSRVGVAGRNGTGVAGDLLAHLISGMWCVLGINEIPKSPPWGVFTVGRTDAIHPICIRFCSSTPMLLAPHRLKVSLHAVDANRDAV